MSAPEQGSGGGSGSGSGSSSSSSSSSSPSSSSARAEPVSGQRSQTRRAGAAVQLSSRLKARNIVTALAFGAAVVSIYGYTIYSISQEHFLDELEQEAKAVRAQAPKTSAETG